MVALMPHGTCFLWDPWLTSLHVIGDLLVVVAYFSIPLVLYLNRRHVAPSIRPILVLFAAFILSCSSATFAPLTMAKIRSPSTRTC